MNIIINDTVTLSIDWSYKVHNLKDVIKKVFMQQVIKRIKYSLDNLPKYAHVTCEVHGGIHRPMDYINQCKITCRCTITVLENNKKVTESIEYYDKPSQVNHDKRIARSISFEKAYFKLTSTVTYIPTLHGYKEITDNYYPIVYRVEPSDLPVTTFSTSK